MKTIEVDPVVPGNRDEFPFPQAKQCSSELDSPSFQSKRPFSQNLQCLQEKLIVTPYETPVATVKTPVDQKIAHSTDVPSFLLNCDDTI